MDRVSNVHNVANFSSAKATSPVTPISDADEVLSRVLAMAEPTKFTAKQTSCISTCILKKIDLLKIYRKEFQAYTYTGAVIAP